MKVFNKHWIRSVAFLLVLAAVVYHLQGLFGYDSRYIFESRKGFRKEARGQLDGVYVGGSDVFFFWQPLLAWQDHGIAVRNYCASGMRAAAVKFFVREAAKSQPDALFIISLNTFKPEKVQGLSPHYIHAAVDYMPLSANTLQMTGELVDRSNFTGLKRLEFYLPIIRYHTRWDSMPSWTFGAPDVDYRSSLYHSTSYLKNCEDMSRQYDVFDTEEPLSDDMNGIVEDLLDYCDERQLNVLFVKLPQATNQKEQGRMRTIQRMVVERGYPCLDLFDKVSETGMDLREDWVDSNHADIHGSMKITGVIGDYLVENYKFRDKRNLPQWAGWDASAAEFNDLVSQYTLPFERDHARRILTDIPELTKATATKQDITVKWGDAGAVDGYLVYRKSDAEDDLIWREVADTDAACRDWSDTDLTPQTSYTYTVVPYVMAEGERVYGSFRARGITAKAKGEA